MIACPSIVPAGTVIATAKRVAARSLFRAGASIGRLAKPASGLHDGNRHCKLHFKRRSADVFLHTDLI